MLDFDIQDVCEADCTPRSSVNPMLLQQRYLLDKLVGVGGMGAVYQASDLLRQSLGDSQATVAVKVLSTDMQSYADADRLLFGEYLIQQQLHHPLICAACHFDVCSDTQQAFMVMEWLPGVPLKSWLVQPEYAVFQEKLQRFSLALQLVNAVSFCHKKQVIHADLKPENIMIDDEGQLTLFDFGVSISQAEALKGVPRLDHKQMNALSPYYSAPELFQGETPNERSDIFSVGCILYKLFTGKHPLAQPVKRAMEDWPEIEPSAPLSEPLNDALLDMLCPSPASRSKNMERLQRLLEAEMECLSVVKKKSIKRRWLDPVAKILE